MHKKEFLVRGKKLGEAEKVLIMVHGRGANAEDIVSLSGSLDVKDFTIIAPRATGNTWYPYSFLSPPAVNEPWLSSAIAMLSELLNDIAETGVANKNIFLLGFSQGACLTLEFAARNAKRYGGIAAFTGGLIGDKIYAENYSGNFDLTPVFLGSSDPDPHIPVERVTATANIFRNMNAAVTEKIYNNLGHSINEDEIQTVNKIIFNGA